MLTTNARRSAARSGIDVSSPDNSTDASRHVETAAQTMYTPPIAPINGRVREGSCCRRSSTPATTTTSESSGLLPSAFRRASPNAGSR